MKKVFKDNLKKITALLLVISMAMSFDLSAFAQEVIALDDIVQEDVVKDDVIQEDIAWDDAIIVEDTWGDDTEVEISDEQIEEASFGEDSSDTLINDVSGSISEADEEARERECIPSSPDYLKKFFTYLSLKYPNIGINPEIGTGSDLFNAKKMASQKEYTEIVIDGDEYPDITKNMVQFRYLANFDGNLGGTSGDNDTVKTLIIRNVDEIRNLYVPAFVETLIIENTTINCYETPGFQCDSYGDLKYCKNLKKLVLKDVKFGDNYKHPEREVGTWGKYAYEKNFKINLQDCHNLEELEIDVSFEGAKEVQLAIDGGTENLFKKLTADKCKINPAPGIGYGQVILYADENSYLANRYNSSETVKFKNGLFRLWLLEAIGIDTNHDGVISQAEMDAIETLTINDQTAHSAERTSLSAFHELADIAKMHKLKTLEIDFYDPSSYLDKGNRHPLKGIDFPDSLENLTLKNIYWEKDTQTKSHDNADIVLTNLKNLKLYNTDVYVKESDDGYFDHSTQIKLTDTEGVLESCIIEKTDVESIELINNSEEKGVKDQDEKQRIRFSASDCKKLESIEFLGEGYAVEGSFDLSNDIALKHIGVPDEGKTKWTVYGEFDSTYAPINVILNSCTNLGSDSGEIVIDYDFINERDLNVQAMDTDFTDEHKLTIHRNPRLAGDKAGKVYLSSDIGSWVYNRYKDEEGFVIENRSSFPTIAVFANGQRIRTSGEGNYNDEREYTEDTDRWVERWNLVMSPGGYSSNFGNLEFYVVDKINGYDSLRKVFYKGDVYVEWEQSDENSIIELQTEKVGEEYKLTGNRLTSTGKPGEVELKLYVYNTEGVKSYIGYQDIKIFKMPDSVEIVNDGTKRGSGTEDDPYIVNKKEDLKLKARLLVNGKVDNPGADSSEDYALRNVYWRIKEYDETPKYTSDSDSYSLYTLDSATKAGISVVRGTIDEGQTEADYDKKIDEACYNHRRFAFDTAGTKFKIVAQVPYKLNDRVITKEVFVELSDKPSLIDVSNDIIHGKKGYDEATITINDVHDINSVSVSIKNPELYDECFVVDRESLSANGKAVWKLRINSSDIAKVKNIINSNNGSITLIITADGKKYEETINLRSLYSNVGKFWCTEIDDQIYTGKAIKPKLDIYYGAIHLEEGKDYTLSYKNNIKAALKTAVDKNGKHIGPAVKIVGKGNYSDNHIYYFSILPCLIENAALDDDVTVAKTGGDIKIKPTVVLGGKKLKQGTDYVVSPTTDEKDAIISLKEPGEYSLYIVGKGNYAGTMPFKFTITTSVPASKAKIQKIVNQNYNDGAEVKPDVNIKYSGKNVTDCFDIRFENNTEIGTATVIVTAKKTPEGEAFKGEAGYSFAGINKTTFKINGLKIKDTKLGANGKEKMPEFTYSGNENLPKPNLYYKTDTVPLIENKDYTIEYLNNINAGTATVLVKGKGKYSGTKNIKFKINKYDAKNDSSGVITVSGNNSISVPYEKGGARPRPEVSMNGIALTENKDYTLSYSNNKAVADKTADIPPTVTVTFKGNFFGKKSVPFTITAKDIALGKITLADKPVSTKANEWKQTVATIVDTNGKKLAAGTDYDRAFEYYKDVACTNAVAEETLAANTTVYVKIKGINNYEGSYVVGSYRISKTNISTAIATIDDKIYTGTAICPSAEDVTVVVGTKDNKTPLRPGVDYEVVEGSCTNNNNKGIASVTIRGMGDYYGTKVVKYRIVANKILR